MKLAVDATDKMEMGSLKVKGSWKLAQGTLFQVVERGKGLVDFGGEVKNFSLICKYSYERGCIIQIEIAG